MIDYNQKKFTISKEARWRDDEGFVTIARKGKAWHLNEAGSYIWKLLRNKKNLNQIITSLYCDFDVSGDEVQIRMDLEQFLEELRMLKLVELKT